MLNNCEAKGLGCVLTLPIYRGWEQHGNGREIKVREAGGSDPPVPLHYFVHVELLWENQQKNLSFVLLRKT